jgi:hypothetical protein
MCPASVVLPRHRVKSQSSKDAAAWGSKIHSWKETGKWPEDTLPMRRRAAALIGADKTRDDYWPANLITPGLGHEVAFALNTGTLSVGSFQGEYAELEAWKTGHGLEWITGTCDWVVELAPGLIWVDDLKTGNPDYLPDDPWTLWQFKFYVAAAMIRFDAQAARVSLTSWPRYPADGIPAVRWHDGEISRDEILRTVIPQMERARLRAASVPKNDVDLDHCVTGDHCKFCDSATACPEMLREEGLN